MSIHARRTSLALALFGYSLLLAGCGVDPPAAPADPATTPPPAVPAEPAGAALVQRSDLEAAKANGDAARCNIETIGDQSLEGVHPTLPPGRSVMVRGWYALPPAAEAAPASAEAPADAGAATGTSGAPAAPAPSTDAPMLVIASENGDRHWTVPLTGMRLRRDVATALGDPDLKAGFDIAIDLSALSPGFYGLHLSDAGHGAASVCGMGRGFVIQ